MIRRTSLYLDFELVDEAKRLLGTTATTETVNEALRDVVRRARLERMTRRTFELPTEELVALRRPADE